MEVVEVQASRQQAERVMGQDLTLAMLAVENDGFRAGEAVGLIGLEENNGRVAILQIFSSLLGGFLTCWHATVAPYRKEDSIRISTHNMVKIVEHYSQNPGSFLAIPPSQSVSNQILSSVSNNFQDSVSCCSVGSAHEGCVLIWPDAPSQGTLNRILSKWRQPHCRSNADKETGLILVGDFDGVLGTSLHAHFIEDDENTMKLSWDTETDQTKTLTRSSKRMQLYLHCLVLTMLSRMLEKGILPDSRCFHFHVLLALTATICKADPMYALAAEVNKIRFTAVEKIEGPCDHTVNLRSRRGEFLEAAGEWQEAIDAYKGIALECGDYLLKGQKHDGGAVASWLNAGVCCRRNGKEEEAERCYNEALSLLGNGEPERVRQHLHWNRSILYRSTSSRLPDTRPKLMSSLAALFGFQDGREIEFCLLEGEKMTVHLKNGQDWICKLGDKPYRAAVPIDWSGVGEQEEPRDNPTARSVLEQARKGLNGVRLVNACDGCKTRLSTAELKRCQGCRMASYCSRECQRAHWKEHKKECKAAGKAKRSDSPEGRAVA